MGSIINYYVSPGMHFIRNGGHENSLRENRIRSTHCLGDDDIKSRYYYWYFKKEQVCVLRPEGPIFYEDSDDQSIEDKGDEEDRDVDCNQYNVLRSIVDQ
jgi:hypothetical protein